MKKFWLFFMFFTLISFRSLAQEFYEKDTNLEKMGQGEIMSYVSAEEVGNGRSRLKMQLAGVARNTSKEKAFRLIKNYEELANLAPAYVKKAKILFEKDGYKYGQLKIVISVPLVAKYDWEMFIKIKEEENLIKWLIIPGTQIGIDRAGDFLGLTGKITFSNLKIASSDLNTFVVLDGFFEKPTGTIPSAIKRFFIEVVLQKVGVKVRRYLEQ